jgi:hypothetical protein
MDVLVAVGMTSTHGEMSLKRNWTKNNLNHHKFKFVGAILLSILLYFPRDCFIEI